MTSSDLFRNAAGTYLARIGLFAVGLIGSVLIARALGPEGRGVFVAANALTAIGLELGTLGLLASNTYVVSRDRRLLPQAVSNTFVICIVASTIQIGLGWGALRLWPGLTPVPDTLFVLALLSIPVNLLFTLCQNLLLSVNEVGAFNGIELSSRVFAVALIVWLIAAQKLLPETALLAYTASFLLGFIWVFWRLRTHIQRLPLPSWTLFSQSFRYGLMAYLSSIFSYLVLKIDVLMVKYILGPKETGYYSIASSLIDMVYWLPIIVGMLLLPKLSALNDPAAKWRLAKRSVAVVAVIMLPLLLMAAAAAPFAIRSLYGPVFLPAAPAFIWLLPAIFFLSIGTLLRNYLGSTGNASATVYGPLLATTINVVSNIFLIPRYGIVGAAYSSVLAYFALAAVNGALSIRQASIDMA